MKTKYKNRYGDVYTFSLDNDGNILWEGKFEWCRCGWPNDYTQAYNKYVEDGGKMSLDKFKEEVHVWDEDKNKYKLDKYVKLVKSDTTKINMVDPSGGPYIGEGYNMSQFSDEFKDKIVDSFESIKTGYKIITKK